MNLEALILEVRPRTPWEAMDLSVRLCVRQWRILLGSWMISVFPVFLIISIVLLEQHPYWAFFLVWLLKPLYDRVPLFVLSRVIFSEQTRWQDVLQAIPDFFKTGILSSLTLYRLDMGRAFALPVIQLEGLRGKQRTQRMRVLRKGAKNREVLLFILCIHLETLLSWGILGLILVLLPTDLALKGAEVVLVNTEPPWWVNALSMLMYFLAMMVIETLYVAGGFMLYLNRRTILEGWDIELTLRKLQQKYSDKTTLVNKGSAIAALLMVCILLPFGFSESVQAAEDQFDDLRYEIILPPVAPVKADPQQASKIIKQVMQEPVFKRTKTVSYLKYTGKQKEQKKLEDYSALERTLRRFFELTGPFIAFIFEAGLWILGLLLIIVVIKNWQRLQISWSGKSSAADTDLPETLFGLDITEQSLPDDVRAQALQLIQSHDYRAALALLYRASLSYLVKHYALDLKAGATEGDCLKVVKQHLSSAQEINYFIELTQAWQLTAYAHRELAEQQMQKLVAEGAIFYDGNRQMQEKADG